MVVGVVVVLNARIKPDTVHYNTFYLQRWDFHILPMVGTMEVVFFTMHATIIREMNIYVHPI